MISRSSSTIQIHLPPASSDGKSPSEESSSVIPAAQVPVGDAALKLLEVRIDALFGAAEGGEEGATVLQSAERLIAEVSMLPPAMALGLLHHIVKGTAMFLAPEKLGVGDSQTRNYMRLMLERMVRPALEQLAFAGDQPDVGGYGKWRSDTLETVNGLIQLDPPASSFGRDFADVPTEVLFHMDSFRTTRDSAQAAPTSKAFNELHKVDGERKTLLSAIDRLLESSIDGAEAIYRSEIHPRIEELAIDKTARVQLFLFRNFCQRGGGFSSSDKVRATLTDINQLLATGDKTLSAAYMQSFSTVKRELDQLATAIDRVQPFDARKVIQAIDAVCRFKDLGYYANRVEFALSHSDKLKESDVHSDIRELRAATQERLDSRPRDARTA